jgi:hypothetical protein
MDHKIVTETPLQFQQESETLQRIKEGLSKPKT